MVLPLQMRAHGALNLMPFEVWCLGDKLLGQSLKDFLRLKMMMMGKASLLPLPLEHGAAWRHGHTHTVHTSGS